MPVDRYLPTCTCTYSSIYHQLQLQLTTASFNLNLNRNLKDFTIIQTATVKNSLHSQSPSRLPPNNTCPSAEEPATMALDEYYHNKIEAMKLEILKGQAALRRLEAQRNDYNSRVRLLREELGLLQQPGSYVGEVVKVMSTKKILVKVHPEGKYGKIPPYPQSPNTSLHRH